MKYEIQQSILYVIVHEAGFFANSILLNYRV